MKDFIVTVFNMQFIMCAFTANGQVLLNSGFGVIIVVFCVRDTNILYEHKAVAPQQGSHTLSDAVSSSHSLPTMMLNRKELFEVFLCG